MSEHETPRDEPVDGGAGGEPARSSLGRAVAKQATRLQEAYLNDEAWAVAALAKLRRGVGREPGEIVELLTWTSPGISVDDYRSDIVSEEERAAHIALTLFAMHQQSHRERRMHRNRTTFGDAARRLRIDLGERGQAGVLRRFNAIGTATDHRELVRHARGLIQQFRSAEIGLDYGIFAEDLRKLADPRTATAVRNRWGRHFNRPGKSTANPDVSASRPADPAPTSDAAD